MTPRARRGYIFVETLVAMAILSISILVIQDAVRQAILTRAQARDYTTARFLLERIQARRMLVYEQPEGEGSGTFEEPFERFSYEWRVQRVEVPKPDMPPDMPPEEIKQFNDTFKGFLGRLTVKVRWNRAGTDFDATAETLLRPELVWVLPPPDPAMPL